MAVTSTTLAGVNVWRFSGAVTDAEIQTAWSALIVNGRYVPGRYIYLDATCDLRSVRGAVYVDVQAFGFILHSSRNAANATLKNWFVAQTVGLSVPNRFNLVRATDGTTVVNTTTDGLDMYRGALIYGVAGNPGGADPRFLCIPSLGNIDGTSLVSQNFTEQQMQPATRRAGVWRGIEMQRVTTFGLIQAKINVVWYRCNGNTENVGSAQTSGVISPQSNASICYVSNTLRKANLPVTGTLADTYNSTGLTTIMFLNNWKDETWFGVSKTSIEAANWNAGNRFVGGVLKKIQVQPETLVRVYDSRSTTASQKSTFSETTADFLSGTNSTTADAVTGRATIVVTGAIATGAGPNVPITRYTGQQFTLQKFGWRVQSQSVDMSTGDDDLSAFAPIIMTAQTGIVRTEAAINAATTVDTLQQLLEQLNVLAIGLVGSASYSGTYDGNLFDYFGSTLTTSFASATVDPSAASKIAFNSGTNALTIRSTVLAGTSAATLWVNTTGPITVIGAFAFSATANIIQATPTNLAGVSITGNLTFNTNTPITITLTNCTITGTVSNSGTGLVSIDLLSGSSIGTVGSNVAAQVPVYVTAPNIINGSRVQLYDVTNGVELFNGILSAPLNYQHAYLGNITVRMRATYQSGLTAKLPVLATGVLTASGLQFLDAQSDDTVYIDYGINGSVVTGFSADYVNTEINLTAASNFTAASLYAWWVYNTTTAQGIDQFFEGITALDAGNLQINSSVVDVYLDNTTNTFIYQIDTIRLFRADGVYPARTVTSGGGGIDVNWKNVVYVVQAAPALTLPQFLALQNP